jgi:uncharacterized protein YuzE
MRIRFDPDADALYIRLDEADVSVSEEVSPGIVLDFDADQRVVGIEVLDVRRKLPNADLDTVVLDVA